MKTSGKITTKGSISIGDLIIGDIPEDGKIEWTPQRIEMLGVVAEAFRLSLQREMFIRSRLEHPFIYTATS